jgi:hypothetical protein
MSRRCKPGIRARIIDGLDTGKIVVVVRRYFGEEVADARWPRVLFPWVVTSLGSPLHSFYIGTDEEAPPSMTIIADDRDLEPLRDDDDGEETNEGIPRPIERETV